MRDLSKIYSPPHGILLLVRLARMENRIGGCVGLRRIGGDACEMMRLFIRPEFRGMGLGKRCARDIIEKAREMGYRAMRLHTLPSMKEALSIYRALGFSEIPPYGADPVEGAIFMEMDLQKQGARTAPAS